MTNDLMAFVYIVLAPIVIYGSGGVLAFTVALHICVTLIEAFLPISEE
jgi:hypothetical protein